MLSMNKAFFLSLLLLAVAPAHGQSPAAKGGPEVRFLAERGAEETGKVVLVADELKSASFDLPTKFLSDPVPAPRRAFRVWSQARNASLASVTLPENGASFIVLLVPAATGGYKPVVIADKDPSFRPGDVYFYNHADKTVLGYVGTAKFILESGKSISVRPGGAKDEGRYYEVGLGVREKDGDRPLSTSRWPAQKQVRTYVFFFLNPRTQRLDFRAVDEFVDPEVAEPRP